MRTTLTALLVSTLLSLTARAESNLAESTLTKVGQPAPSFAIQPVAGGKFNLEDAKGKVVLVNFFATWCGPCLAELPHLEKEVWSKFKDKGLLVIAIGREHKNTELEEFRKKQGLTFPVAGDEKREVYAKYASAYIPRNVLIGKDGKILFQSVGFEPAEFAKLVEAIKAAL